MPAPDDDIRRGLERLSDPAGGAGSLTFERLAVRRRRRQSRRAALAAVPVVALLAVGGALWAASDDHGTDVATGADPTDTADSTGGPDPIDPQLTVERTEVVGGSGGTVRVVMEFDGALPVGGASYVEDLAAAGTDAISWTTQNPDGVAVCADTHFFPEPAEGTVDLLIPAAWFAAGEETHTSPLETIDNPAKFVVCGPHEGHYQYSIWGPVSADPADVTVTIDRDRTRLTVEISPTSAAPTTKEPPSLDPIQARAAESLVVDFLEDLRRGDTAAAAGRWTGYPELAPDADPSDRIPHVAALADDPIFARVLDDRTETIVNASWGWTAVSPVVTVLAPRSGDEPPAAVAFLVGTSEDWTGGVERTEPGRLWIHRLPTVGVGPDSEANVAAGGFVEPGQRIVVPGVPVEGDARAYLGGQEIPLAVDNTELTMSFTIPDDAEGDVAVTISTATPELPGVHAFAWTVRPE